MNLDLLLSNLSSPALLFFALGIFAVQVKSDLNIPEFIKIHLSLSLVFNWLQRWSGTFT
jgi:hypothetical protein